MSKPSMPLFTRKAQGQGFGFAVAKRMVVAHGGSVESHSQAGHGSTFTIMSPQKTRLSESSVILVDSND